MRRIAIVLLCVGPLMIGCGGTGDPTGGSGGSGGSGGGSSASGGAFTSMSNVCDWLTAATVQNELGLSVALTQTPGGALCTYRDSAGTTQAIVQSGFTLDDYKGLTTSGTPVSGLGTAAIYWPAAMGTSGNTEVSTGIIVELGTGAFDIIVQNPTTTPESEDGLVALAKAIVAHYQE